MRNPTGSLVAAKRTTSCLSQTGSCGKLPDKLPSSLFHVFTRVKEWALSHTHTHRLRGNITYW